MPTLRQLTQVFFFFGDQNSLELTRPMDISFHQNVDSTYSIKVNLLVFVLVSIAHPIQRFAVQIVLFVA